MLRDPEQIVGELLPLLRCFSPGPCAVGLGGSCAKGHRDAHSDVDVYLFANEVRGGAARDAAVVQVLGSDAAPVSWGSDELFVQGGTDFEYRGVRVECWLRSISSVDAAIAECLRGEVRRAYVAWTVSGFFNHAVLADVLSLRIVEDAGGVLARWRGMVAVYPAPLRDSILRRFMGEAAFWPGNAHYHSAIQRGDVIYTAGIVQLVVHALVQVLFALNRVYFPGEKLLAESLRRLPVAPRAVPMRMQALLAPDTPMDVAALRAQREEVAALVAEVRELVERDGSRPEGMPTR